MTDQYKDRDKMVKEIRSSLEPDMTVIDYTKDRHIPKTKGPVAILFKNKAELKQAFGRQ